MKCADQFCSINRLAQGKMDAGHTRLAGGTGSGLGAVVHEGKREKSCECMRGIMHL